MNGITGADTALAGRLRVGGGRADHGGVGAGVVGVDGGPVEGLASWPEVALLVVAAVLLVVALGGVAFL